MIRVPLDGTSRMSMVEEVRVPMAQKGPRKRQLTKKNKGGKAKKLKGFKGTKEKVKITASMKKLFQKRAQAYNSDDDDDEEEDNVEESGPLDADQKKLVTAGTDLERADLLEDEGDDGNDELSDKEDIGGEEIQPGITKFSEGNNAFKHAFKSIMKKIKEDDTLGPVLSAHKQLVVKKLAEEEDDKKVKSEAKKEKHVIAEKGHVKPADYLDSHEKFLIGVATKGVVKLFNAVNKSQYAQKGLNPSRFKDDKVIKKRRKEAFFSELGKTSTSNTAAKGNNKASGSGDNEEPAWAPLRDNYMLTNPKLKDWDKKQDTAASDDDFGGISEDGSSGDD